MNIRHLALLFIKKSDKSALYRVVVTQEMVQNAATQTNPIILVEGTHYYLQPAVVTYDKLCLIYGRSPRVLEFQSLMIQAVIFLTPEVALGYYADLVNTSVNENADGVFKFVGMDMFVELSFEKWVLGFEQTLVFP